MGRVVTVVLVILAIAAIAIFQQVNSMETERVTEDVHVIFGQGSNVGVLRTEKGAVVVDTMAFRQQGRRILELAEDLTGGPVQAIVNTHYHWDHVRGNPAFAVGSRFIATERTLEYLRALDADYFSGAAEGTLPNETFVDEQVLRLGDKTLRLLHPGRGHTDGDLVVLFVEDRVLHTGDLFFNGRYPNIDLEAGGSVQAWVATIDRILELDFDRVIPGHGPVTDRAGLRAFQDFMRQLALVGVAAEREGRSLAETQASAALDLDAGYESVHIPFVVRLDRDFVIRRAWEETHGAFTRHLPQ